MEKLLLVIIVCHYMSVANAEIYKWVDEQGHTHYGDRQKKKSTQMDINIQNNGNFKAGFSRGEKRRKLLESFDDDRARENKEKVKSRKNRKKKKRYCALSKDRLRRYQRASSLYNLDKDGNRVTISNEARQKETQSLRDNIKKYCK